MNGDDSSVGTARAPAESHPYAQNTICVVAVFHSGSVEAAALFLLRWITGEKLNSWRESGRTTYD